MARWVVDSPQKMTFEEPVEQLDVYLISGRLNVVGTDGEPRVEVTRASRAPLTVEHRDGRLSVRQERIPRWPGLVWWLGQLGRRFRVEVSIAVPVETTCDLKLVDGAVIASGLSSSTHVDVTSGQVILLDLRGRTTTKIVSGPVEALGVVGDLAVETVSGELILADSAAERVTARTISGAITCDLDNPRHSDIRLGTTSGSVTVRIREDSDLRVDMHTTNGRITSAFDQLGPDGGSSCRQDRHGVLGAGEGRLSATTVSGSITLLSRPVDDELMEPIDGEEGTA